MGLPMASLVAHILQNVISEVLEDAVVRDLQRHLLIRLLSIVNILKRIELHHPISQRLHLTDQVLLPLFIGATRLVCLEVVDVY